MAFIVEDGTVKANANSYVSLSFANNYFMERNVTSWDSLDDDVKKAALISATDYIEIRFQFKGQKYNSAQSLSFPMVSLNDVNVPIDNFIYPEPEVIEPLPLLDPITGLQMIDPVTGVLLTYIPEQPEPEPIGVEIPLPVQKATCEYAIRSIAASLVKDFSQDLVTRQRTKIGDIEKEIEYSNTRVKPSTFSSYPMADLLLRPYLKSQGSQVIR